ncbi:FecR domain-containing protein [Flavivirga abyssicola]|uniref:FecR family protein n=1 Tax=Flavivirga abyssicola TaxID=3063533 RepID=UPI0026DFE6C0|nr:FecR domain-containing protein [Flavivirga sp. MEBiC07777]WVK14751.1 FecR domain-containing protein [Flavivirga sp. MEBiC07777]
MTKLPDIVLLTNKFLEGKLTKEESTALEILLSKKENIIFFKEAIKDDYLFKNIDKDFDTDSALSKAIKAIEGNKNKSRKFPKRIYQYAAAAVLLLCLTSLWYVTKTDQNRPSSLVEVPEKNIELILGNGQKQLITGKENDSIVGGNHTTIGYLSNDKLSYVNNITQTTTYNTLCVPHGKTFQVALSDGTKVDLNAGTTLKYPVNFLKDQPRQVYLEGEAYFDVTHDANHKFIVNADNLNIEVLGTEFNISSYAEDATIETTLEEGSVKVYDISSEHEAVFLTPNEQSSFNKKLKTISKKTVNTKYYTSWRQGALLFKSESFTQIVKKLERSYNVIIIGYDETLGQEKFTATFRDKTIEQIILYFSEAYGFNYKITKNKITINVK